MSIRGRMLPVWQGGLIVLFVFLAYLPILHCGFIWDDYSLVINNPLIKSPDGLYGFWCTMDAPDYWPMTSSTWWLEWRLWGDNPVGYHLVNVTLHALNAVLWWRILARLGVPAAWFAAALFAIHPVNVESAAWISEQKNTLAMFFCAWALLGYVRFDDTGHRRWYWLALGAFVLALLSKTAVVMLPFVLLGIGWWRRARIDRRDVLRSLPFFAAAGLLGCVTLWFASFRAVGVEVVRNDSFWSRLAGAGWAVWFYVYKAVLPLNLCFVYPRWQITAQNLLSYVPGLLILAGLVAGWTCRHRWGKPWLFGFGYYLIMLFPALGFVNIYFMRYSLVADHYQYFSLIALIALAVNGGIAMGRRIGERGRFIGRLTGTAVFLALGVCTWKEVQIYRDEETIWRDTVTKNPDAWLAHGNLGLCLYNTGRNEEAAEHFHRAIQINPDCYEAINNLGLVLAAQGRLDAAIENYRRAIRINPGYPIAMNNLGFALATQGRLDEAIENYRAALRISPKYYAALNNLGMALATQGRLDEAIADFQKAVLIQPYYADFHLNWGVALDQLGRTREAMAQYQEALRLNPNLTGALNNLAWMLAASPDDELRNGAEAVRLAERACELTHYGEPLFIGTLAAAYAEAGRFPEAVATAEKAEQLATTAGLTAVAAKNRQLLERYRAGKPCHEPAPTEQSEVSH